MPVKDLIAFCLFPCCLCAWLGYTAGHWWGQRKLRATVTSIKASCGELFKRAWDLGYQQGREENL